MASCKECIHYEPCFEYGNILDPVHGGVICDSFKSADDVVEVRHGEWHTQLISHHNTFNAYLHICKECGYFYKDTRPNGHNYCPDCGTKMDAD